MGSTGCHLTCIVSAAATQRQIVLYYDVVTHQQPVGQEAWYREKVATYSPYCNAGTTRGLGCWGLQPVPLGAAHAAAIDDSPVLLM